MQAYFVLLLDISVKPQPASTMLITICRYHTQGVKEVPSSLAHWRKKIGVETTCVEIKFQAPHAIDATLSRYLRQLDNLTHWLLSTQVPRGRAWFA